MKQLVAYACLGLLVAVPAPAFAGAQQDRMKNCNAEAKEKALQGDERKAFMKKCLSNKPEAPADKKSAQQERMKNCNAEAKEKALKGDERKKFMSSCLKG
ncbi:MAG: PsiF repeat-containing protein [Nitrosomonadales bacterium]|nr:PsiF repeat-containing protein [Nitrosomonadales bacterium]